MLNNLVVQQSSIDVTLGDVNVPLGTVTASALTATTGDVNVTLGNIDVTAGDITAPVGTVTALVVTATSDARLKKNIERLPPQESVAMLRQLQPVRYHWKHDDAAIGAKEVGFVAQDVQKVLPSAVRVCREGMLSLNYSALIPVLCGVVQDLEERLSALER